MNWNIFPLTLLGRAFGVLMGLLLAVQLATATLPVQRVNADGTVTVVICGTGGAMQTVTLNLITGEVDTAPASDAPACPYCVLGAVALATGFQAPFSGLAVHPVTFPAAPHTQTVRRPFAKATPIRAPPAVLG